MKLRVVIKYKDDCIFDIKEVEYTKTASGYLSKRVCNAIDVANKYPDDLYTVELHWLKD